MDHPLLGVAEPRQHAQATHAGNGLTVTTTYVPRSTWESGGSSAYRHGDKARHDQLPPPSVPQPDDLAHAAAAAEERMAHAPAQDDVDRGTAAVEAVAALGLRR